MNKPAYPQPPEDDFSGPPGDAAIRRAMAEGQFDQLPGQGQPLRMSAPNPFVDEADALANDLLAAQGFAPGWVEQRREIEGRIEGARQDLRRALRSPDPGRRLTGTTRFKAALEEINRAIRDHNLALPRGLPQMLYLREEVEIQKAREGG